MMNALRSAVTCIDGFPRGPLDVNRRKDRQYGDFILREGEHTVFYIIKVLRRHIHTGLLNLLACYLVTELTETDSNHGAPKW